jgi:hypothetical protein
VERATGFVDIASWIGEAMPIERVQHERFLGAELWSGAGPPDAEELQRLVVDGLEKGFLSYDEIAAALEDVELTREQSEDFYTYLVARDLQAEREFWHPTGYFAPESVIRRLGSTPLVPFLGGGPAALLQVAHPLVAAGVFDHSDVRRDQPSPSA